MPAELSEEVFNILIGKSSNRHSYGIAFFHLPVIGKFVAQYSGFITVLCSGIRNNMREYRVRKLKS